MKAPPLNLQSTIDGLPHRTEPYWNTLEFCRHLGLQKRVNEPAYWVARIRTKKQTYLQHRLASLSEVPDFAKAVDLANEWFSDPAISKVASPSYPVGINCELKYEKTVSGFTIGDAMKDYVEWKRIAAAKTHYVTNLSLINHHIIPRLGDVLASDLTSRLFTDFCRDVLETPPKRGNQRLGPKVPIDQLDHEALRKRKQTLNTLVGILRLALRMAWENNEIESDRAWRCLRRVPNIEVPRHYFLNRSECRALMAACRPDLRKLVAGALFSGCRVSELADLHVRDVGNQVFGIYVAPLKSYRGRYVILPEEGMSFFLDQCAGKSPGDLVFVDQNERKWAGCHRHIFKRAVRRAGLPESFVFHGLRHTYASQLVQAGMPLAIIARQLGHSNTDSVSRTYGHLSCVSIEMELSARFARLTEPTQHDERLSSLRRSIKLSGDDGLGGVASQRRNSGLGTGPLVAELLELEARGRRVLQMSVHSRPKDTEQNLGRANQV